MMSELINVDSRRQYPLSSSIVRLSGGGAHGQRSVLTIYIHVR